MLSKENRSSTKEGQTLRSIDMNFCVSAPITIIREDIENQPRAILNNTVSRPSQRCTVHIFIFAIIDSATENTAFQLTADKHDENSSWIDKGASEKYPLQLGQLLCSEGRKSSTIDKLAGIKTNRYQLIKNHFMTLLELQLSESLEQ